MDMNFPTLRDLYNKLLPVLKTKVNEMNLRGIDYINERDIWEYQKNNWKNRINLEFSDMVNDILNTNDTKYEEYIKQRWRETKDSLYDKDLNEYERI